MVLKLWNRDGVGIVKVSCLECRKECGGDSGSRSNTNVANLFSNFKSSHLTSSQHIKNWCRKHNVNLLYHPTSVPTKGKVVPLSSSIHKELIKEGISIMEEVNEELDFGVQPFSGES